MKSCNFIWLLAGALISGCSGDDPGPVKLAHVNHPVKVRLLAGSETMPKTEYPKLFRLAPGGGALPAAGEGASTESPGSSGASEAAATTVQELRDQVVKLIRR